MLRKYLYIFILAGLVLPGALSAAEANPEMPAYMRDEIYSAKTEEFERGSMIYLKESSKASYKGQEVEARAALRQDHGLVLPDGRGGVIVVPGEPGLKQNPQVVDARELKLKIRELASQLVAGLSPSLAGNIALPTAFVHQDDFERSSSFGRFISEQLFYEFNQRGLRTREYRMAGSLSVRPDGEFILTREAGSAPLSPGTLYVVGTYYTDGNIMFLNARLVRQNGDILRTAQLVMQINQLTRRMLANSGRKVPEGGLEIKDFNTEARRPEAVTAFDRGLDIH